MNLATYIAKRLILMVCVLLGVLILVFVIFHMIPADPVGSILGGNAPPEMVEELRHELGLDKSLYQQFLSYIRGVFHGDLGVSLRTGKPVWEDIKRFFPATIELTIVALIISIAMGIPLGIISAVKRNKVSDHIVRVFSISGVSFPVFWTGLILLMIFYYKLGWLPGPGRCDLYIDYPAKITNLLLLDSIIAGNWSAFFNGLAHLILPAFVLGYSATANIARITRSSMLDVLMQDYIITARAKGLRERAVIMKHAFKNAMLPTITIVGLTMGALLEGAVLTETIFAWPGLGRYITNGLIAFDYPSVMGGTLYIAIVYSLINLIVDISYGFLDPRIRV